MGKRMVCLLMALLMTMAMPVWAGAVEGGYERIVNEVSSDEISEGPAGYASYQSTADGQGSLYNTLTARQKNVYNALKNITWNQIYSSRNRQIVVRISGITGQAFTGYSSGGRFYPTGSSATAYKNMDTDINAGLQALKYDRPEYLWLDGTLSWYYSFQGRGSRYTLTQFSFGFTLVYGGQEGNLSQRLMTEARNIANTASREKDMYNKVKVAHDILAARSSYNYPAAANPPAVSDYEFLMAHNAYGAMFKDQYEPVCESYSKALKVILNQMDIPCVLVVSDNHMWNNVKMDDGLWYNLDLTWDDSGSTVKYSYFLVGSSTRYGSSTFAQEHREYDPIFQTRISSARYPKKSTTAYEYLGRNYRYSDVSKSDYGYEHIEKVSELGYFSGDNGKFNPGKNITRAEFASVIAKAMGVNTNYYKGLYSFPDVGTSQWYSGVVYWAKASGVMSGSGGKFRPNDPITRQEMCTVMKNALSLPSYSAPPFADHYLIASWAMDGVYACRALGLVNGFTDGSFGPNKNTSRRDAAIVLSKYAASIGR